MNIREITEECLDKAVLSPMECLYTISLPQLRTIINSLLESVLRRENKVKWLHEIKPSWKYNGLMALQMCIPLTPFDIIEEETINELIKELIKAGWNNCKVRICLGKDFTYLYIML